MTKKHRLIFFAISALLCGAFLFSFFYTSSICSNPHPHRNTFRQARLMTLADALASKADEPGRVLVIHRYDDEDENGLEMLNESLAYLNQGFAGQAKIVKAVNPYPPHNMESEVTEEIIISGERLNALIEENKDCNIVIFLGSLPFSIEELKKMTIFYPPPSEGNPPPPDFDASNLPLVGTTVTTNLRQLKFLFKQKRIDASVYWNPNTIFSPDKTKTELARNPRDWKKIFDLRYLLITPETVESISRRHPKLFKNDTPSKPAQSSN